MQIIFSALIKKKKFTTRFKKFNIAVLEYGN